MIENRHTRVDYLLETAFPTQEALLDEIVKAMSDQEFDDIYQFICRMHDIEPDEAAHEPEMDSAEDYQQYLAGKEAARIERLPQ